MSKPHSVAYVVEVVPPIREPRDIWCELSTHTVLWEASAAVSHIQAQKHRARVVRVTREIITKEKE